MRRKYSDCQRADGNCSICSLVNYGRDCHNRPITNLELARHAAGLTQKQLAEAAGLHWRIVQKVENGEAEAANMTAKSLLAIADALEIDLHSLL